MLFLAGCLVGPNYKRPQVALPDQFRNASAADSGDRAAESVADTKWFDLFDDDTTKQLVTSALERNFDLRIAASRRMTSFFIELKASHKNIKLAYEKNLSDYKDTIPQAFWYNGIVILSNGSDARIGSMTAGWVVGYAWLIELGTGATFSSQWSGRLTSMLFGVAAALTLDEFALWLNLRDVYWEREGRESFEALALFGGLLAVGVFGWRFWHGVATELASIFRGNTAQHPG